MLDVIIALAPAMIASVILFGPRAAVVIVTCVAACVLSEYLSRRVMKRPQTVGDLSCVVTGILLALMLIAVFGNSIQNLILALGVMSIPRFARISRSGFIKYRDAEFIKAARSRGAGDGRIIFLHILPNIVPELIVTSSLGFAGAVMSEAGLSYLGLGIQPPTPSFGKMLSEAQGEILKAGWYVLVPALAITLLVMGFNLIGDALQEVTEHGR